jgi:DNA polymerase-1
VGGPVGPARHNGRMSEKTLLLVDGSSYLYRAYHAMPDLRSPDGFPTGAIHGIVAMMKWLRERFPAEHAACVFDAKGPTFRDAWYPEYKAQRTPMPDPLRQQIEPIHEVVRLLGWPVLEVPGIEADDAIGTLARVAAASGHQVLISTGDKDLAQLVTPEVTLINTMAKPPEKLDVEGVKAKFGVPPERIIDYLTLIGDVVDNVPGVDKVGPKTAAKWIADFGSLDGVVAAADGIKGVAGENLRKALNWLPTGRKLITVVTDCDLTGQVPDWPALEALALRPVDAQGLRAFYERFGFKTWLREFEGAVPVAAGDAPLPMARPAVELPRDYETVTAWERLDHWLRVLQTAELAAIDTETDSLDPMRARIVGISFAVEPGRAAYVPLAHAGPDAPLQLPLQAVLDRLRPWLEDPAMAKVGQNIKYDRHVLANAGITVRGYAHDTMLQSYVLEAHKSHGLEALAERHLGRKGLSYEALCGKGANQIPFAQVDVARATEYSGEDSEMTLQVHQSLWPQVQADAGLRFVYERIEVPVSEVLARVERHGVLIDAAVLARQSQQLAERLVALEQEAYTIAGQPFNMGSPKQIGEILFGKLGLPVKKKTATGAPSTDEEVLQELAADYPLPARILEHRSLAKLKGTYTDKLPLMVNPATGRVHTNYRAGRGGDRAPVQQRPQPAEHSHPHRRGPARARGLHRAAGPRADERRLLARSSCASWPTSAEDAGLLRAFARGLDVHSATASEVFGAPVDEVSSEQRRYAKVINFGLIYGMGAFGLAQQPGHRAEGGAGLHRALLRALCRREALHGRDARQAAERAMSKPCSAAGCSCPRSTPATARAGRRRAPGHQRADAGHGGRPHQAGDDRRAEALDAEARATRMVMQVHDELVLEVPDAEVAWAREAIPRADGRRGAVARAAAGRGGCRGELGPGPLRHRRGAECQVS